MAVDFQVGDRSRLHCTSIGKAILAYQDASDIERVIACRPAGTHAYTIIEPAALRRELQPVRERGYAIDDHELHENMRCIAVPIFERDVPVRMGISCSGPDSRFTLEYLDRLRGPLLAGARELSAKLGGKEPSERARAKGQLRFPRGRTT